MSKLRLDGVEVCLSQLTQKSYRAACCDILLPVTPNNKEQSLAEFQRAGELGPYRGLRICGLADLSFLEEFPLLLYLEIVDQEGVDTRYLAGLENLRGLRLESPGAGIDFAWFPHLEVFVGDWHADNCNLHECRELRQLIVWKFKPRSADLSVLANITRLEWLELIQTNITSLEGVETLEDLRYLEIAYASRLQSLDAFASRTLGIRELGIEKAKRISSYKPITALKRLRRLRLSSCTPMPDLKWTSRLKQLDFFSFVETNVEDGDLSPLLNLPKLRYVGTTDKRHYNYKCDRLNEILTQRASRAAAKRIGQ